MTQHPGQRGRAADELIELRVANHELRARVAALEEAVVRERRQRASYERFAHLVAHDLRGALTTLSGIGQMADRQDLRDGLRDELVRRVAPTADRAARLLERLFAHAEAGVVDLRWEATDLEQLVDEVCDDMAATLVASRSNVTRPDPLPTVWCDPDLVHQLVHNLVANAVRHGAGEDGAAAVTVLAEREGDDVVVTVADRGRGFPADEGADAFALGRRRPGSDGLGLGMATARTIVERHGGRIWLEAQPDGGAAVRFTLPASSDAITTVLVVGEPAAERRPSIHRFR